MLKSILLASSLLFSHDMFKHASVGIYVMDTESNQVVLNVNSQASLIPSSTLKLLTTGVALELLGSDFKFSTYLEYDGSIEDGILNGNLFIRGEGDPCLGSNRIHPSLSMEGQIDKWVDCVQKAGISKIKGRIIGDDSKWEKALAAPTWYWEDLGNYYGAGASALSFNENSFQLVFKPGLEIGSNVTFLKTIPVLHHMNLHNELTTGAEGSGDKAYIYGSEYSYERYIRGSIPLGVPSFTIKGSLPNPALFCALSLQSALNEAGILIDKTSLTLGSRRELDCTRSPVLEDIVYVINRDSHNLYAEHLIKKLGEGSLKAGCQVVKDYLLSKKVDLEGFKMVDGSGLSRNNLITAKQLVEILCILKKTKHFPILFKSLTKKQTQIYTKSGSMTHMKSYTGYAGKLAFAIIVNQTLDVDLNEKTDRFLEQLDRWSLSN